jgi:hypothetical protein
MLPITTAQIPVIKVTAPGPYPGARDIKMDLTFQSPLHRSVTVRVGVVCLEAGRIGLCFPQRPWYYGRFCCNVVRVSTTCAVGAGHQATACGTRFERPVQWGVVLLRHSVVGDVVRGKCCRCCQGHRVHPCVLCALAAAICKTFVICSLSSHCSSTYQRMPWCPWVQPLACVPTHCRFHHHCWEWCRYRMVNKVAAKMWKPRQHSYPLRDCLPCLLTSSARRRLHVAFAPQAAVRTVEGADHAQWIHP